MTPSRKPGAPKAAAGHRAAPRLAVMVAMLVLAGCASVTRFAGIPIDSETLYVANVPALRQTERSSCGPTCVAAVTASFGISPAALRERHANLGREAGTQDLITLAEDAGLRAYAYEGTLADVEENLRRGLTPIVMVDQAILPSGGLAGHVLLETWNAVGPKPAHWVVVVGLAPRGDLILHDPAAGPVVMSRAVFLRHWKSRHHLTVLITDG